MASSKGLRMNVIFAEKDRDLILSRIHLAMGGRQLESMVSFKIGKGCLVVIVSKLGTSTLRFKEQETSDGLEYVLESEKIAFSHRVFRDEVRERLIHVISLAGGQVANL